MVPTSETLQNRSMREKHLQSWHTYAAQFSETFLKSSFFPEILCSHGDKKFRPWTSERHHTKANRNGTSTLF
jgi:hypothetical protein